MAEEWSLARRMAQPFLENLALTDWSGADILDLLRGEGLGYRMTNFYDDLRQLRGLAVSERYVKGLASSDYIPRRWMGEVERHRGMKTEKYRYRMEAVFRDPDTGEEETQYLALLSGQELSKGEVLREGRPMFDVDVSGIPGELTSIELLRVYHIEGTPY